MKHDIFNQLLHDYVDSEGRVNYNGFIKEKEKLLDYISLLEHASLDSLGSQSEQLAFWINAYNAISIFQVITLAEKKGKVPKSYYRFGIFSALLKRMEDTSFIVAGLHVTLSEIENKILRGKFSDPRIHSVLNCATDSCPIIRQNAYQADHLDEQLEVATKEFVNSDRGVLVEKSGKVQVSKILISWYKNDFKNSYGTVLDFLKKYAFGDRLTALGKLDSDNDLVPMKYDWKINK